MSGGSPANMACMPPTLHAALCNLPPAAQRQRTSKNSCTRFGSTGTGRPSGPSGAFSTGFWYLQRCGGGEGSRSVRGEFGSGLGWRGGAGQSKEEWIMLCSGQRGRSPRGAAAAGPAQASSTAAAASCNALSQRSHVVQQQRGRDGGAVVQARAAVTVAACAAAREGDEQADRQDLVATQHTRAAQLPTHTAQLPGTSTSRRLRVRATHPILK